jgi:hypothetical protein
MATTAKNRIVRQVAPNSCVPDLTNLVSSACTWNQGDLLYLDTATHLVKPLDSDGHAQYQLGIAVQTVVAGKPKAVYTGTAVDASTAIEALAGPVFHVVAKLKLKSGDSFVPGAVVYYGGDAQTVSVTGTYDVGVYQGPALTAASGSEGNVYLSAPTIS